MRYINLLSLIIFYLMSLSVLAKNQLVFFEPKSVVLNGVIKNLTFPGPPNYESIKNGDADETGPYLILDKPIDIKLISGFQIGNDEPEKNVKLIQLVVHNGHDWKKMKEDNYVHITGTLFHALTGHHHARILLWINKIDVLSKHKVNNKLNVTDEDREFLKYQNLQN